MTALQGPISSALCCCPGSAQLGSAQLSSVSPEASPSFLLSPGASLHLLNTQLLSFDLCQPGINSPSYHCIKPNSLFMVSACDALSFYAGPTALLENK